MILLFLKIFLVIISCFLGYIFGSVNFAILISRKIYRKDIKKLGSKNAGTTNILRNFGLAPAIITFLGDILKGFISILVCQLICFKVLEVDELIYVRYLFCAITKIGHRRSCEADFVFLDVRFFLG